MHPVGTDSIISALRWRYATKKFDPARKIDGHTWKVLEETLVLSPSSFGLQPWKFLVVTNPEIREKLLPISWGQKQVVDASHLVIFTVKHPLTSEDVRRHILRTAEQTSVPVDQLSGFENAVNGFLSKPPYPLDLREWSTRQVYLALATFMTSAALLGVDTCPMEGLNPAGYDQVLGLEGTGYYTVAACPVGYRAEDDKYAKLPKVRHERHVSIAYIS